MKFVKFFHRYEVDGGIVVQDQEAVIAIGSYILFHYPKTGEFLQVDEKIDSYPGAVGIELNEYVSRIGFFRGWWLILKNFLGISHCKDLPHKDNEPKQEAAETFEEFFECSDMPQDLRPPIIIGGIDYEEA